MAASLTIHTCAALPEPGVGKRRGSANDKGIKMDRAEKGGGVGETLDRNTWAT